jgi:hypothetical protein
MNTAIHKGVNSGYAILGVLFFVSIFLTHCGISD